MPARVHRAVVLIGMAIALAPPALADVGTPLIWAQCSHLFLGNAVIGLIEGLLIAALFKTGRRRAIAGMVMANYTSMLVGVLLFNQWALERLGDFFGKSAPLSLTVENAVSYHVVVIVLLAIFTAIVEWPFCYLIFRPQPKPLSRSVKGCLLAQFVSYVMLCACYMPISYASVVTRTTLADPASFAQARDAWIYFISPADGDVWKIHLDGAARTRVCAAGIDDRDASLFFRPTADCSAWDLRTWSPGRRELEECARTSNLAVDPALPDEAGQQFDNARSFERSGLPMYIEQPPPQSWRVRAPYDWPEIGLTATNLQTGQKLHLAMATPLLRWLSFRPVVLPGDQVVYQLGDQIVLLDLNERKLGLITLGRGLAVARDRPPAPASAPTTSASSP